MRLFILCEVQPWVSLIISNLPRELGSSQLNWRMILPHRGLWQCLETFLPVTAKEEY